MFDLVASFSPHYCAGESLCLVVATVPGPLSTRAVCLGLPSVDCWFVLVLVVVVAVAADTRVPCSESCLSRV